VIAARVAKLRIRAPSDGAVALLVAEPGEAVVPGQPLMTLEAPGRGWASFNLGEDQLDGLSIGLPETGSLWAAPVRHPLFLLPESSTEYRSELEVWGPHELIDRDYALEAVAAADQLGGVAREGGGVTG
jgi:hypothetical protein